LPSFSPPCQAADPVRVIFMSNPFDDGLGS
jgi:hypothetical protein